jgi:hypothetical protein
MARNCKVLNNHQSVESKLGAELGTDRLPEFLLGPTDQLFQPRYQLVGFPGVIMIQLGLLQFRLGLGK